MPLEVLKEEKKQKTLIMVFIFLVFLIFVVIFIGKLRSGEESKPTVAPAQRPERVEINFGVLENPALKELIPLEEVVLPEEKGRDNPLYPYYLEVLEEREASEESENPEQPES